MYCRDGPGIKIGPGETENLGQFWVDNKIFVCYRAKIIQAVQIFNGPRWGSPIHHLNQTTHDVLVTNGLSQWI